MELITGRQTGPWAAKTAALKGNDRKCGPAWVGLDIWGLKHDHSSSVVVEMRDGNVISLHPAPDQDPPVRFIPSVPWKSVNVGIQPAVLSIICSCVSLCAVMRMRLRPGVSYSADMEAFWPFLSMTLLIIDTVIDCLIISHALSLAALHMMRGEFDLVSPTVLSGQTCVVPVSVYRGRCVPSAAPTSQYC